MSGGSWGAPGVTTGSTEGRGAARTPDYRPAAMVGCCWSTCSGQLWQNGSWTRGHAESWAGSEVWASWASWSLVRSSEENWSLDKGEKNKNKKSTHTNTSQTLTDELCNHTNSPCKKQTLNIATMIWNRTAEGLTTHLCRQMHLDF